MGSRDLKYAAGYMLLDGVSRDGSAAVRLAEKGSDSIFRAC